MQFEVGVILQNVRIKFQDMHKAQILTGHFIQI